MPVGYAEALDNPKAATLHDGGTVVAAAFRFVASVLLTPRLQGKPHPRFAAVVIGTIPLL
jgi:hypothetical protein